MSHRIERINNLIRQETSEMLQRQVKDPRLDHFVAVTEVSTSPDLKYAKIYVSCICSEEEKENTLLALESASGFFRKEMSRNLRLRYIPLLSFLWDDSIERADRLMQIMDQVNSEDG